MSAIFNRSIFNKAVFNTAAAVAVIDTHDGANKHYRKRAAERAKIREEIERLFDGRPVSVDAIEAAIAASPEPLQAFSQERIAQMVRTLEALALEKDDEEIVMLAGL